LAIRRYSAISASGSARVTSISVDPVEHRVEGRRQLGHLVVGAHVADALVQGLAGEVLGGGGDLLQRPQRPAGQHVRGGYRDHRDDQDR
jgi:hypothetical protein